MTSGDKTMMTFEAATLISGEHREALLAEADANRLAHVSRRARRPRPADGSGGTRFRMRRR
jgi:hypothetical protein